MIPPKGKRKRGLREYFFVMPCVNHRSHPIPTMCLNWSQLHCPRSYIQSLNGWGSLMRGRYHVIMG